MSGPEIPAGFALGQLTKVLPVDMVVKTLLSTGVRISGAPRSGRHWRTRLVQNGAGLFAVTGNPLYAWLAYQQTREFERGLPETDTDHASLRWLDPLVMEYFDGCAERLLAIANNPTKKPPATLVAEALGFKRSGRSGRGSKFSDFAEGRQFKAVLYAVRVLVRTADRHKPDFAIDQIAAEAKVHRSTIARAWRRYRETAMELDQEVAIKLQYRSVQALCRTIKKSASS